MERVRQEHQQLGLAWNDKWWEAYLELFGRWAGRVNLVSGRDRSRWVEKHVLPSLALLKVVEFPLGAQVVDIGSGAGFPGLPLALGRPDCRFFLVEPKRWRALFLQEVVETLALSHVEVIAARAEEPEVQSRLRGRCDLALARAVADLVTEWRWGGPLLRRAGGLLAYKGQSDAEREAAAVRQTMADAAEIRVHPLPGSPGTVIVEIRKGEL